MGKYSSIIRTILFNILVILTIIFIYILFFPKKSYIKEKLDNGLNIENESNENINEKDNESNSEIESIFNKNINILKETGENYLIENKKTKVTLEELINNNLITDIKDSNNNSCSNTSYVEKKDNKTITHLECSDKTGEIIVDSKECLYQYEKKLEPTYTNWSEWSEWDTNKVEANELTNVEEKTEKVLDGTRIITDTKEVSINATKSSTTSCPEGFTKSGNECTKKTEGKSIKASVSYSCPGGYSRTGAFCYKLSEKIDAIKSYYCPKNTGNTEYELSGETCKTFNIIHSGLQTKDIYSCPQGYNLSNDKCYKTEQYQKEVDNYKEVTYYRYQTREKEEKIDVKWSKENDEDLLNQEYNMVDKVICEF